MSSFLNVFNLFKNLTTLQKSLTVAIVSIVLFIASSGVSYSLFSRSGHGLSATNSTATPLPGPSSVVTEAANEPKTESCPLNGAMHTKEAQASWETRRPLAVMIENHIDARPQSGLSSADVVYEAVAEGGITRFMAVYLCNLSDVQVGPVRSARTYFLDWLSEYDALYAHVGGANMPGPADALGQIIKYGIKDLNQFGIGFPTYWRDYQRLGHPVATEHTMHSTTQKLWDIGAKRGWAALDENGKRWDASFIPWKFKEDAPVASDQNAALKSTLASKIDVDFWQSYSGYSVTWEFDKSCDCYKRKNAGTPHLDLDNNQQLSAKNIVVQFERESHANDGYEGNVHLLYKTTGQGKALIFQDGKVIEGQWIKPSRLARSKYVDGSGKEISFNRGPIWIETVPEGAKVSY